MERSTHSGRWPLQDGLHREGQGLAGRHLGPRRRLEQKVFGVPVGHFHGVNVRAGALPELPGGLLQELLAVRRPELHAANGNAAVIFLAERVLDERVEGVEFHGQLGRVLAQFGVLAKCVAGEGLSEAPLGR